MDAYSLLRKWLDLQDMTQRRLAEILGVGESTLWAWGQGRRRPSLDLAVALERLTRGMVPAAAWASDLAVNGVFERATEIDTDSADSGCKSAPAV